MNELRVVSGFHRGVSLVLDEDPIVIGASLEADLILTDPGIVESHVKIENNGDNSWQLFCLNGTIKDNQGNNIESIDVVMGQSFDLSGVWVQFADKNAPWPSSETVFSTLTEKNKINEKPKSSLSKLVIFALVGVIGLLTVTHATVAEKKEPDVKVEDITEMTIDEPIKKKENIDILAPIFKKMLKERELQNVKLVMLGDVWNLEGSLEPREIEKLKRMIIRFSKRNPHSITINNNITLKDYSLPFDIVKVISGPYGHVEARDGHKLYLGSEYKGVTLVSITKNELIFSGERNITVNW